jgi:hypothetical protein
LAGGHRLRAKDVVIFARYINVRLGQLRERAAAIDGAAGGNGLTPSP